MIKINDFRIKFFPEIGEYSVLFIPKHEVQFHHHSLNMAMKFVVMSCLSQFDKLCEITLIVV